MLSPLPAVTSFLAPVMSVQTYLVAHGLHLSLSPLLAMAIVLTGHEGTEPQQCNTAWPAGISLLQAVPFPLFPCRTTVDVSSGSVCVTVRVSTEGFSQCTPDSADRTVLIPPCQNWHHYQLWWFLTSDSFQNQIRSNKSLALAGINQN